jgi:hypothetical protein
MEAEQTVFHLGAGAPFLYTSLRGGDFDMDVNENIIILLAQEQTLLSRERTMHSYMQTGLAFSSVGLVIMKFLVGILYFCAGLFFIVLGALLILEAGGSTSVSEEPSTG